MTLPADPAQWQARWRDDLAEREAIMACEGVPDARERAERDVRRVAERGE